MIQYNVWTYEKSAEFFNQRSYSETPIEQANLPIFCVNIIVG